MRRIRDRQSGRFYPYGKAVARRRGDAFTGPKPAPILSNGDFRGVKRRRRAHGAGAAAAGLGGRRGRFGILPFVGGCGSMAAVTCVGRQARQRRRGFSLN
ncbi:hypothetical protein DP61_5821 [Burkholderia pseudomallei]|nr:hypothetical protein DP61_5821 [Burkholderia pseudomallei]